MAQKESPWAHMVKIYPHGTTCMDYRKRNQFLMQLYRSVHWERSDSLYATLYGELSPSEYESEVFSISGIVVDDEFRTPTFT